MEIYSTEPLKNGAEHLKTFAVCSGIPPAMGGGKVLSGYSILPLEMICEHMEKPLKSLKYYLTSEGQLIFSSDGNYKEADHYLPTGNFHGKAGSLFSRPLFVHAQLTGSNSVVLSYQFSSLELFLYAHRNTPLILLIVTAFGLFSLFIYSLMLKQIGKEVSIIQLGLNEISQNHLDYRIPTDLKQNGLHDIAESVNLMSLRLSENINRAYYYELKQREAELSGECETFSVKGVMKGLHPVSRRHLGCFERSSWGNHQRNDGGRNG